MTVLVTGADGFVGRRLVARLARDGHHVVAATQSGSADGMPVGRAVALDVRDPALVAAVVAPDIEVVLHLAAVASGMDARRDPGLAWDVNASGTARLCEGFGQLAATGAADPLMVVISTAEVYGAGPPAPRVESDRTRPCSPYGASKLGAEIAAREVARRTGLRLTVVRPFPHSGPGQNPRFVVPAFAARLRAARERGDREVRVGNLDPIRDLLHVSDVVEAYTLLLAGDHAGETYNVGSGQGLSIRDLFDKLASIVGVDAVPVVDPEIARPADIPHLVGDSSKLRASTGWEPRITVETLLEEVVSAQAD